jgi:DNA-binding IclR family transcriptional regulator
MAEKTSAKPAQGQAPAVIRAIQILRRLGEASEPMGARQLARELELVPSTCLHVLKALASEGLVEFDSTTKHYTLGIGILAIARAAIQHNDFATLARPVLTELSTRFGVTVMATQLMTVRQMIVVAIAQTQQPFRLAADLGSRFPELISATGRCVAAFNEIEQATLRSRYDELPWDNPPGFETWLEQVRKTRCDGYGVDRANYLNGLTIVAVPVFGADARMTKGLVAVGISETIDAVGVPAIASEMMRVRDELSGLLLA